MSLEQLMLEIGRKRNVGLILGAGISAPMGIPMGYKLPMDFGAQHQDLMFKFQLHDSWFKASQSKDRLLQKQFVSMLVKVFPCAPILQEAMLAWLMTYPAMMGMVSDDHSIFIVAWLKRVFRHLITTNWDFLLEWQVDALYDTAYTNDPFQPIELALSQGIVCQIPAENLFFQEPLNGIDYAWNPRWEIVANQYDLVQMERWSRPIWKIHGSPFFLSCQACRGINRWKRVKDVKVGDPCPDHPAEELKPEIIFWDQGIDRAYPKVWQSVRTRLLRCDLIVVVGLSGCDTYIRDGVEKHNNIWIVSPEIGEWNTKQVNFIQAYASDFTYELVRKSL